MNRNIENKNTEKRFLESYEAYADALFRFAFFQVSNHEVAKDITQDVFMNAWKYVSGGPGRASKNVENMRAFLYASMKNRIIDYRRKKKEDSLDELADRGFDAKDEAVHANIERGTEALRAFELIGKMDETYREPLLLRFLEGLSIKEVAEIVGESENAVSVRIHRGIKKLQEIMHTE